MKPVAVGLGGRPGPEVPGVPGLYVVGDWVGPEGVLSDASLASAKSASQMIIANKAGRAPSESRPLQLRPALVA